MRISASKLNAAIANNRNNSSILASGAKISEAELMKLRKEGGYVSHNTAFILGIAFGVDPRSLLASATDVAEYDRHSGLSHS